MLLVDSIPTDLVVEGLPTRLVGMAYNSKSFVRKGYFGREDRQEGTQVTLSPMSSFLAVGLVTHYTSYILQISL